MHRVRVTSEAHACAEGDCVSIARGNSAAAGLPGKSGGRLPQSKGCLLFEQKRQQVTHRFIRDHNLS